MGRLYYFRLGTNLGGGAYPICMHVQVIHVQCRKAFR
jgi:hypothetical protein